MGVQALVPKMVNEVIDRAMQVHGAEGICQDTPLAALWAGVRTLRFADGPDVCPLPRPPSLASMLIKALSFFRRSTSPKLERRS